MMTFSISVFILLILMFRWSISALIMYLIGSLCGKGWSFEESGDKATSLFAIGFVISFVFLAYVVLVGIIVMTIISTLHLLKSPFLTEIMPMWHGLPVLLWVIVGLAGLALISHGISWVIRRIRSTGPLT
jgi:hypothetical protein